MTATYTIKNLRTVEDSAPQFGLSDFQEARFAFEALEASDTGSASTRSSRTAASPSGIATSRPRRCTWCCAGPGA